MGTVLTDKAEEWVECSSRLLLDTPAALQSSSDWSISARISGKGITTKELKEMCDERGLTCSGSKSNSLKTLAGSFMGPDLPADGVRMCHPGIAMGYDTEMRNPAWCAYRLNPEEQRATDNARKSFELDPALKAAGSLKRLVKGHVAPRHQADIAAELSQHRL